MIWGRNQFAHLRFYRVSPDSAYVSSVIDLPWQQPASQISTAPFAHPNPSGVDGMVWLDLTSAPAEARYAEVVSALGQRGERVELSASGGTIPLQLPPTAGIYAVVLLDAEGRILARQMVVRP